MLWLLYFYTSQICLSNMNQAGSLGFPLMQNVSLESDGSAQFTKNRYYNLIENICICSNERTSNGVPQIGSSSNGICEDVSNTTHQALYDFGTDCDDCGSRGNYPSYVCDTCSNYMNVYDLTVSDEIELVDGIYCDTPRGNALSLSVYDHMYLSYAKLYKIGELTEMCKLYWVKNHVKIPFTVSVFDFTGNTIQNITTHPWQSPFTSNTFVPSTISNLNVSTIQSPEVLISISKSVRLVFQSTENEINQTFFRYLYVSANRVFPFKNFRFELSYITSQIKDLETNILFDAYISYSNMECLPDMMNSENLTNHVTVNTDCTIQSQYSRLFMLNNNELSLYPLIVYAKFPQFQEYIPVVRYLHHSFYGIIQTNFHFLEPSRFLLEFRIDANQFSLLQMYGLKLQYENITLVNNTFCRLSVQTSVGEVLKPKNDMGAENKCVWVQSDQGHITEMNFKDNSINVIYAKIPVPLSMLGTFSKNILLFGVEVSIDGTSDFSLSFREDPVAILVTSFSNRPSSMCSVQEDIVNTMPTITCSPNILHRQNLVDNMGTNMMTKSLLFENNTTEYVSTTAIPSEGTCLNDNIVYTASSIEFGKYVANGMFVPIGPVVTNFNCQNSNVLFGNSVNNFDMCQILNSYHVKVNNNLRTICCNSCSLRPPFPPTFPISLIYPPFVPAHPPAAPPPPRVPIPPTLPPPYNQQSNTIYLIATHPVNVELSCSNSSNDLELHLYETYVTHFTMNPCDAQNVTSCVVNIGSVCTVVLSHANDPLYLDSATFYTNFNPDSFTCQIQGASVQEVCTFTIEETRLNQFLQSPSPPPFRSDFRWIYTSISQCIYLLRSGQVEDFVIRSNGTTQSILVTSSDYVHSTPFSDSCSVFTNFMVNIQVRQTEIIDYTFQHGYQFSPIANWTRLFLDDTLQFTTYDNGTELSFPGNDTKTIDFKSFLMNSYDYKTVSLHIARDYYPPPSSPPASRRLSTSQRLDTNRRLDTTSSVPVVETPKRTKLQELRNWLNFW